MRLCIVKDELYPDYSIVKSGEVGKYIEVTEQEAQEIYAAYGEYHRVRALIQEKYEALP
jgi:hypothetical protein